MGRVGLYFTIILSILFASLNLFASSDCKEYFQTPEQIFQKTISVYPKWKQKILSKLWLEEIKKNRIAFTRSRYTYLNPLIKKRLRLELPEGPSIHRKYEYFLPYALDLPHEVLRSLALTSKIPEMGMATRFLAIPAKLFLTDAISNPYQHLIFILGFGATGYLLYQFGIAGHEDLDIADPNSLKENEVILFLQLHGADDSVVKYDGNLAEVFKSQHPDKTIILKANSLVSSGFHFDQILNGKKIRQVFIQGHGSIGRIYSERLGRSYSLDQLSALLNGVGFRDSLADEDVVIAFGNCEIALDKEGKQSVRNFAEAVIPHQGRVIANTYTDISGEQFSSLSRSDQLLFSGGAYIFPVGHFLSNLALGVIYPRVSSVNDYKGNDSSVDIFQSATFEVEVNH